MKFIVYRGNLSDGFIFFGVFDTYDQAFAWGQKNFDQSHFHIGELLTDWTMSALEVING